MRIRLYQIGVVILAVTVLVVFPDCVPPPDPPLPGKVTGGGFVEKTDGSKANFGFNGSSCDDPLNPTGRFNFHDRTAPLFPNGGVKMKGAVLDVMQCVTVAGCTNPQVPGEFCPYEGYVIEVGYKSTNPNYPGSGTAWACVVDNGEGKHGTGDLVGLAVPTNGCSPYSGYSLKGLTIRGNIQGHPCPAP